ncbi:ATP-binding protein [Taibaiella soli]|uniref:histidine kinase n=1 Tax=Taibaiella soli TaxID=1649169 RepID=A0A2W2B7K3_9BACT|nr:ATP-binding protein [Taibaiella soli]PZF72239.1 hypothetical protein DN068_15020 [Taibaiella soli]
MQLKDKLKLTGAVIAVFFLGYIYQAYLLYQRSTKLHYRVYHTDSVLNELTILNNAFHKYESATKSYIAAPTTKHKEQLTNDTEDINQHLYSLKKLTKDNPDQQLMLGQLSGYFKDGFFPLIKKIKTDTALTVSSSAQAGHITSLDELHEQTAKAIENMTMTEKILWNRRTDDLIFYNTTRFFFSVSGYLIMGALVFLAIYQVGVYIRRNKLAEEKAKLSSKKYQSLIDDSAITSIISDTEGNIRFISKNVQALTGYSASDLKGVPIAQCMPRAYRDGVMEAIKNVVASGNYSNVLELEIFTFSRVNKWINCRIAPLFKNNNEIEELQVAFWDMDEEMKVRMELEQLEVEQKNQQVLLQNILDNLPNFVFVKDAAGKYQLANKKLKELLDVGSPDDIGIKISNFVKQENVPDKYSESDWQVLNNKAVVSFEEKYPVNGVTHYFQIVKFPLLNEAGEVTHICGITTDISEHRESENELRAARKTAEQAKTAQETFLANMSHEIRTPMNGIIGMSNLLLSTKQDAEQKEFTETILESSSNLLSIINDLLDFSKIKSGKFMFEYVPFRPRHVIRKAIYPLQFKAEEKRIGLNINIADDIPEILIGDPLRLQQIVINLMGNAIKFTSEGSVTITVSGKLIQNNAINLRLSVVDTGIGIPENKLDYIFESFTQNNVNTSRQYGGTGLGLAIVKQLAEMQHGQITVASKLGKGSEFTVEIPFEIGKEMPVVQENKPISADGMLLLKGMQILVAEDNVINQKVVKNTLSKQGAVVDIASNGREAIALAQQQYYDVILMDLQMPEVDGYKATRHIRQVLKIDVPVIAMTADALKGEAEKCFDAGMSGFISKPFDPNDLYQQLLKITNAKTINTMTTQSGPETTEPLIDLSYLDELSGNDPAYMYEVMQIFLSNMPEGLEKLEGLIRNTEDWDSIYRQAHFLKSSVSIVKIRNMYDSLAEIEDYAKKKENLGQIPVILDQIVATFKEAHPLLIAERDRNKPEGA